MQKERAIRIWKQSQSEEDMKKYCEAKKMLREQYMWLWIRKLERRCRSLIRVVMVVNCLELRKGLGRRKMLLGLVV